MIIINQSIQFIQQMAFWKVTYIFKAEDKLTQRQYADQPTYERLLECISAQKGQIERAYELSNINAFIKIESNNPNKPCKYIKLSKPRNEIQSYLQVNSNNIIVEYFHAKKQQEVRSIIRNIGKKLDTRQKQLKDLNDELKDQINQLRAVEIISQAFKRNTSEQEKTIEVALMVSDPLVDQTGELPIFQDEVDIPTHVQRLKRASISNFSLFIKVKRYWGNREEILNLKSKKGDNPHHILIMQFFTRVVRVQGQLMISLEKGVGKREWEPFQVLFADSKIDLLIVVGVGAYLLKEANYTKSLILISTCSMEQRRPIFPRGNETQNQYSYNDTYSQIFLQKFFQNIFSRMEIEKSIRQAEGEARDQLLSYNGCCCLHEHIEGCKWSYIVSKIGEIEAHRLFKHRINDWNRNNFFKTTIQLQKFLLSSNNKEENVCAGQGPCCYKKDDNMQIGRIQYHRQNLSNLLIWNIKNWSAIQSPNLQGINKFLQSEEYDKPTGRKRPLTIYKLIQQLIKNDITIMKSPILSLAKRYLSFAKEYLQVRKANSYFHEIQIPNEMKELQFKEQIEEILKSIQNRENIILYIQILHNQKKSDNFYDRLLQEHPKLVRHLNSVFECKINLRYIFLTCDPNFNDRYASYRIDEPLPPERYHYFLSKYSHRHISTHLDEVFQQIKDGDRTSKQAINEYCENYRENNKTVYIFLGFLAQFSEDGFYLTKSGRVILEQIFNESTLTEVINNKLPLELITLSDSIFIQMLKPYQQHFKSKDNYDIQLFNQKRLQYYYLLLRVYYEMLPQSKQKSSNNSLRYIYHKEGLFSIDIEADEENKYDEIIDTCKQNISANGDLNEMLYSHDNFRHKYHINQIEKILQQALKKKRTRLIGSKSALRQEEPKIFTYLLWNIALKSWAMCKTIEDHIQENVSHFQKVLLVFVIKAEAKYPLAEIARLQLYILLGKQAPKPQDGINFGFMTEMLSYLRNYANRQLFLSSLKFEWGNTNKFKDLLGNCFTFAQKIRDMLTPDSEDKDYQKAKYFIESISYYRMYDNFTSTQWNRELLKLSERKVLYYFQFTKMLKSSHNLTAKEEKKKEFHREFKLREIAYEFRALRKKLKQNQRKQEHRVLIDLYLGLLMNQSEANGTVLNTIKGKIKPEYMLIFNHLCQKIEQKALFNQNGLIICARARTIILDGKPCLFTRKRNLTMVYLKKLIEGKRLKISYFTLTPGTLNNLTADQSNNRCEMLYLILTVDAPSADYLLFGSQFGIQGQRINIKAFANQLKNCKIKILILCGQNSTAVCKQLQNIYRQWPNIIAPVMIALSSNLYSLGDTSYNEYKSSKYPPGKRVWQYLSNEVSQIAMDLLIIATVANINKSINEEYYTFTQKNLTQKVTNSHRLVKRVLNCRFTCANQVLDHISFSVFFPQTNPYLIMSQIPVGKYQDLTTIFYSSQNNLFDQKYYENVGRNIQVHRIITAINTEGHRLVEVIGNKGTGKSTILQQVCWICQTKSLFKFGIWKFDLKNHIGQMRQFFESRQFKNISSTNVENEVLIVLDNVNEQFLSNYQQYKPLLSKLAGKEITLIYSTNQPEVAPALQKIIQIKNPFIVNVNHIDPDQIYGLMISHIKQSPATIYTQEVAASFEEKVCQIMEKVKQVEQGNRLSLALSLLKGSFSLNQSDTNDNFYNFYNQHFETLKKYLHNYREIQIHFT